MKTKTIRIKKKGGGSRLQRVQVLASGKYKFIKNTSMSRTSKKSKTKSKSKGGRKTTAKKGRRSSRRSFLSVQSLGKYLRAGAFVAPAVMRLVTETTNEAKIRGIIGDYTGYDIQTHQWTFENLMRGWLPYLGAVLATVGIPKISGMIRRL